MRTLWCTLASLLILFITWSARADATSEPPQGAAEEAPPARPGPATGPVTMHVGIELENVSKFDLTNGSFNMELVVTVHCDREPCDPQLNVRNGVILGKPEKLHDEPLVKKLKIKAEVDGYIDLSEYPHDDHALIVYLEDKADPEEVRYVPDTEHTKLGPRVRIAGWDIDPTPEMGVVEEDVEDGEKVSSVAFGIQVKRPRMASTFKTLVPVFFMLFVAAFALLLKPKSAAGRLSTATGGLMGLVMFHVGQINSLPPLGYLTRLDKFFIATYLVYLVHIGISVAIVRTEEAKKERVSEMLYLVAAGGVPGLALVAWLMVWLRLV